MKAMILAAGFGTRLRSLTEHRPKALVPVANRPVIGHAIDYLKRYGVSDIVVNAHHFYQQIQDYLDDGRPFNVNIKVLVEPSILGTGGGIRNSSGLWNDEPFMVINSDIITDVDLEQAYMFHKRSGCIATLVLHDHARFNQVLIDGNNNISDIGPAVEPGRLAFTGIHIIQPELLSYIPASGPSDIIDCYRGLISSGIPVRGFISKGHYWRDIGSIDSYVMSNKEMAGDASFRLGTGLIISPDTRLMDWCVIGNNVTLENNVTIERSILWDNVIVKHGVTVKDCVVTSSGKITSDITAGVY